MKTNTSLMTVLATLALAATPALAAQKPEAGKYTIDAAHSKVGFEVSHLVISTVEGLFKSYQGEFEVADKFTDSKVSATVDSASIDTGNEKRDEHLRSADFFEAEKHPKLTFVSKKITGSPEKFKMTGDLTIRGVTKEVTFDGKYLGSAGDGWGNTKAAFEARAKINRKDFGLTWNKIVEVGPTVGDEVALVLRIQAAKAK